MLTRDIVYIIVLVVLIIFSAGFSGMDMAFSLVRLSRLEAESFKGDRKSSQTLKFAKDYDSTIATILFGNDFVNILASSITSLISKDLLEPVLGDAGSWISSFALLFILLLFGEITPKALAKNRSYFFCRHSSGLLKILKIIFFPFVYPINLFVKKVTSLVVGKTGQESQIASDEELENMVDAIADEGIIDSTQSELLHKSLDFKETNCYEIMTPRVKIYGYDIETPLEEFLKDPDCFFHSRLIVYKRNLDNILGYIPIKVLLKTLIKGRKPDISSMILPIVSVPRTMMISSAMKLMKENRHHIAVVRDEYGGTEGIITMEDILEELVGEIWDEDEKPETFITKLNMPDSYLVHGNTNIDDFMNSFGIDPDDLEDEFSTLSGFITHQLGRFPKVGDLIYYMNLRIEVIKMNGVIVDLAIVLSEPKENDDDD